MGVMSGLSPLAQPSVLPQAEGEGRVSVEQSVECLAGALGSGTPGPAVLGPVTVLTQLPPPASRIGLSPSSLPHLSAVPIFLPPPLPAPLSPSFFLLSPFP